MPPIFSTPLSLTLGEFGLLVIVAVVAGAGVEGAFTFLRIRTLERALDERNAELARERGRS